MCIVCGKKLLTKCTVLWHISFVEIKDLLNRETDSYIFESFTHKMCFQVSRAGWSGILINSNIKKLRHRTGEFLTQRIYQCVKPLDLSQSHFVGVWKVHRHNQSLIIEKNPLLIYSNIVFAYFYGEYIKKAGPMNLSLGFDTFYVADCWVLLGAY